MNLAGKPVSSLELIALVEGEVTVALATERSGPRERDSESCMSRT